MRLVALAMLSVSRAFAADAGDAWDPETFEPLARAPVLTVSPQYPERARRERLEGRVTVCFRIRADGSVERPYVLRYSHRWFRKPALKAIRGSTFEAATISQPACRTYHFRLKPVETT